MLSSHGQCGRTLRGGGTKPASSSSCLFCARGKKQTRGWEQGGEGIFHAAVLSNTFFILYVFEMFMQIQCGARKGSWNGACTCSSASTLCDCHLPATCASQAPAAPHGGAPRSVSSHAEPAGIIPAERLKALVVAG